MLTFLFYVTAAIALGAESTAVEATVLRIRLATTGQTADRCGAANVAACTQFVGQVLEATCVPDGDVWAVQPRVRYTALVYMVDLELFHHEKHHLRDMEKGVGAYVDALRNDKYSTRELCSGRAVAAANELPEIMRAIARRSNGVRH